MDKKLVVNDFLLVVNGDLASCKSHDKYSMHASCITENIHTCAVPIYSVHFD